MPKCKNCKTKFKEIKYRDWLKYFCWSDCKQEYLQEKFKEEKTFFKNNTKPIKKISDKKRIRLKEWWSEKELFEKIWKERKHICSKCWKFLQSPKPHNFDHIKTKGSRPDLRLNPDNIEILCFSCHYEKTNWWKYKWIDFD